MTGAHFAVVVGTRPEAIKMVPVIEALNAKRNVRVTCIATGQHRELLDQVLRHADIVPDHDLGLMRAGQSLDDLGAALLTALGTVFDEIRCDRVIVHGDTLSGTMAALAAYFRRIPVAHVEAGLRSGDMLSPWPEEGNRRINSALADLHFAPTNASAEALLAENIAPESIHLTGNTVIDALQAMRARITTRPQLAGPVRALTERYQGKRLIAVTAHRRENMGAGMRGIAEAMSLLAARDDVAIAFPLHPNQSIADIMRQRLSGRANVALLDPLDYPAFVALLDAAHLVLTDSGGVQEEAPALGTPVLVMRETTERPEGIAAGTARLVGTDPDRIVAEAARLLDEPAAHAAMARAHNPYGDGRAASRIANLLLDDVAARRASFASV